MMNRINLVCFVFAGIAACGGKVVFVEENPDGGGGASATTSGTTDGTTNAGTTGSGMGGFTCDAPLPMGEQQIYACLTQSEGGCASSDSLDVFNDMSNQVNGSVCANNCCTMTNLVSVPCGPDPTQTSMCCYYGFATVSQQCSN